jgi:hypothetical protein
MNVTFHVLASFATTAALSTVKATNQRARFSLLAAGLIAGVILHGILDILPHSYPINSILDVMLALILFAVGSLLVVKAQRLLFLACYLGAILPDLVDLGPAILNKRLGTTFPVIKLFPWHWKMYSGSIYDGSKSVESALSHMVVLVGSLLLLFWLHDNIFRFDKIVHWLKRT